MLIIVCRAPIPRATTTGTCPRYLLKKRGGLHTESRGEASDAVDRHVLLAALNHAHIGSVDARSFSKLLLTQAKLFTQSSHVFRERVDESDLCGLPWHAHIVFVCILLIDILRLALHTIISTSWPRFGSLVRIDRVSKLRSAASSGGIENMAARIMALGLALLACLAISACDPLIVAATYSGQRTDFQLLSSLEKECPRIYRDSEVLYLLRATGANERTIDIYNPQTGLIYGAPFARTTLTSGVYGGQASSGPNACWLATKGWKTGTFTSVRYVQDPSFRESLNSAFSLSGTNEQTSVSPAVTAALRVLDGSSYPAALSDPLPSMISVVDENLDEAKTRLLAIPADSVLVEKLAAEQVYAARAARQQAAREEAEREREERIAAARQARVAAEKLFAEFAAKPKEIGMEVCSADNRVGYVDRVALPRIQIQIVGQIVSNSYGRLDNYWIYRRGSYLRDSRLLSEPRMIWEQAKDWADCSYPVK